MAPQATLPQMVSILQYGQHSCKSCLLSKRLKGIAPCQ
ncbi:hypothetical protein DUNSADRAFT_11937 [Dunaliella salina]|uniref:Uncharacterized protein n=1 Tax=Dunaliella salina TaxID=3046 RepID=A0ABQ7FSF6_DUNSA|nr:hypothetical protein DUNSADRAFT_11937 [Dunaliella salina]|eukprot:KAF5825302.1 hypothetical protein DUNSADRAFT_11937 [Dunaliella salina]